MNKGGGLGSMAKGLGGKISKLDKHLKDKTVSAGKKTSNKITNITNKVSEATKEVKNIESSVKDKLGLDKLRESSQNKLSEGMEKLKNFDENISEKQAKSRIRDELLDGKSVVNRYGLFGPATYKYLIYIILFLNICCIVLLTFNKNIFYRYVGNQEVDVRLNKNVFYIYIFSLFLFILQLYTLKENYDTIVSQRGKYQVYLEIFNVLCTLGLTYYIYTQIDFIHTDCPEPNKKVCVKNNSGPNDIHECPNGSFQCGNITYKEYSCRKNNCDNDIANNFYLVPPPDPPKTCTSFSSEFCKDPNAPYNASGICTSDPCTVDDCCKSSETDNSTEQYFTDLFNRLIRDDENRIQVLEDRIKNISAGGGIPGPPGPAGPPGTPGSDSRPTSPSSNQFENILCPNEPGGLCKDGQTRCNDQGMCEGFALISLQDKIDLKLKYKDLNSNAYKADNLMNNLETFLLNTLK